MAESVMHRPVKEWSNNGHAGVSDAGCRGVATDGAIDDDAVLKVQEQEASSIPDMQKANVEWWSGGRRTKRQCGMMVQVRSGRGSGVVSASKFKAGEGELNHGQAIVRSERKAACWRLWTLMAAPYGPFGPQSPHVACASCVQGRSLSLRCEAVKDARSRPCTLGCKRGHE